MRINSKSSKLFTYSQFGQTTRESQKQDEEKESRSVDSIDSIVKSSTGDNHLAQWVRNSHQIPPPDNEEVPIEEWTAEELAARAPKETSNEPSRERTTAEDVVTEIMSSDIEQQSTASSASLSTVKSNSVNAKKNGSLASSKENSTSSINICRRCHR